MGKFRGRYHLLQQFVPEGRLFLGIIPGDVFMQRMAESAAGAYPAVHEGSLQAGYDGACYAQVRISPLVEIVVVQVHAAHIGHLSVYHQDFPVILAVDAH